MRRFLLALLLVFSLSLGGFFAVGEFYGGWVLGRPPQTPVLLYKKNTVVRLSRVSVAQEAFGFTVRGRLRRGTITVRGYYEDPMIQGPLTNLTEVFEATFKAGETVNVSQVMREGPGVYRVRIYCYDEPVGVLRVNLPPDEVLLP